jgi:hypothetical protein
MTDALWNAGNHLQDHTVSQPGATIDMFGAVTPSRRYARLSSILSPTAYYAQEGLLPGSDVQRAAKRNVNSQLHVAFTKAGKEAERTDTIQATADLYTDTARLIMTLSKCT